MRRAVLLAIAVAALLPIRDSGIGAQAPPDGLTFFKNYLVTGDYVTAGIGLRGKGIDGLATDVITVGGVPAGADIVAAFLYWQVVTTTGADTGSVGVHFNGYALSADNPATPAFDPEPFGKALAFSGTAPCFNPGGSTGESSAITWTYRADVLRFFEADFSGTADTNPNFGKLIVNGPHQVTVPDSGPNGNNSPMAMGASVVVIYRVPSMPLSAIVLYDDGVTLGNEQRTLVQSLAGFYQASTTPDARISYIVGSGQADKNDFVVVPGAGNAYPNVFSASAGTAWDDLTYAAAVQPNASTVATTISNDVSGGGGRDCLTLAAIVLKTGVQDTDNDGLLDILETVGATGGPAELLDPLNQPLPALGAMGADPGIKDVFIEMGYMGVNAQVDGPDEDTEPDSVSYGGVLKPPHSHLPGHAALKQVGDAFRDAPVPGGIRVHFDLGQGYPAGSATDPEDNADEYIIRGLHARGGDAIDEMGTVCTPAPGAPEWECQFAGYPGTVGWKTGFRFLRDQVTFVNGAPAPSGFDEDVCGTTVDGTFYACERRFDANRQQTFHYALFAHAIGLPKSELPCLNDGTPVEAGVDDRCAAGTTTNPDFHTPRTNTGIGDFPGADALITLGGFPDVDGLPVGTPFMQASTLMHELGHHFERRHGGEARELNCQPTYFSVMNYLYQLRGLLDDQGMPHLDYSRDVGAAVDESNLTPLALQPYRLGWYAPLESSYLAGQRLPAQRHCSGSELLRDTNTGALIEPPMVRIDGRTSAEAVDWDADNDPATPGTTLAQDVNFNGVLPDTLYPSVSAASDWSQLGLNQVGVRRNVGAIFVDPVTGALLVGPLSADVGKGDLGKGDLGKGDLGKGDLGKGDLGKGDLGKGDLGKGDLGKGDLGKGDLGGGDLFENDPNNEAGELDAETAGDLARTPPNGFAACVVGIGECGSAGDPLHRVLATWSSSNTAGSPVSYRVYRVQGGTLLPGQAWTVVADVPSDAFLSTMRGIRYYAAVDATELPDGGEHTYFAVAVHGPGDTSDPSNLVTITAVNDPADAVDDDYDAVEDTALTVAAPGVLGNDSDPDSVVALSVQLVTGPSSAQSFTLNTDGSFSYVPAANVNGSDQFSYAVYSGASTTPDDTATVRLSIASVNDAPAGTGSTATMAEDEIYTFGAGDFGFTDPDDTPANALAAVRIATLPPAGTLRLGGAAVVAGQSIAVADIAQLTFTPAANGNGTPYASFTFQVQDDGGTANGGVDLDPSPDTIAFNVSAVNDVPTIAPTPIPARTIDWNTSTGPIALTIDDADGLAGLTLSGSSSNTTLVPGAGIVFGGAGGNRTVTITPAANQYGTTTITVTVSDGTASASTMLALTVNLVQFTFVPVSGIPPSPTRAGSTASLKWQYQDGSTVLNTASLTHTITVCRVVPGGCSQVDRFTNTDSGNSSFRYSKNSWTFNLQTKDRNGVSYPLGEYQLTIVPDNPAYQSGGPYTMTVR